MLYRMVCFFFKQKTEYEMRISDWSSDVCSSDLKAGGVTALHDIRTALGEDWRELESGTPDMAAQFAENRIDADRAVERLETLLRVGNRDQLDFFLSGQFYGAEIGRAHV